MNWIEIRMVTLLEYVDEGDFEDTKRLELREELLAFFGEVHVELCRRAQARRSSTPQA